MSEPIERVADLTEPGLNRIYNMSVEAARAVVDGGDPAAIRRIDGSFALVARSGKRVRMARSIDRPLRYFIAKRHEGPSLVVADRISAIHEFLRSEGLDDQFQPSYTRMVPAHYVLEIQLLGCPDPNPKYTRFCHPLPGRRAGPPPGAGISGAAGAWPLPGTDRGRPRRRRSGRGDPGDRRLQGARRAVVGHGARAAARHPGAIPGVALSDRRRRRG